MERITVSFYDEIFVKLTERAQKKNIALAQYVRDLVDIGLRVEDMSTQKNQPDEAKEELKKELELFKKMLHKDLVSSQETLYLVRNILGQLPEEQAGKQAGILEKSKEKARSFVDGFVGEES